MPNNMLIDAAHPEETRVVVQRGNKVEEFDFEAADRRQLRGNIYLAKVTRVEPSLQAAFVDYGGNRHGFLAFSEIHPDYYQIPVADRQALMEEHARADAEDAAREEAAHDARGSRGRRGGRGRSADAAERAEPETITAEPGDHAVEPDGHAEAANDDAVVEPDADSAAPAGDDDVVDDIGGDGPASNGFSEAGPDANGEDTGAREDEEEVEHVGAEDVLEELPVRNKPRPRQYKIQEVIKRRQVMLVQVVKEERGNKGAALTTYLSLAGRYSVLMPNTARGGGISRKITNAADRKRLKEIAGELDVAEGMGVILRTAGANRTKAEVRRDFEYLLRLWENVRELTLKSSAPMLVYEEGSLIKRSIRDLYSREIDQVLVAGDDGYREAKDFMRMLMPSHARNVQQYKDEVPIFVRNGVEQQLDAMFSPHVTLRSGGYVVINQTEALVAIDVNSGRSTREHSIEDTALQTNLQAAEEVSRQLRLRDLAGLIVIDFIDMEEKRNIRAVEKKLKDCLKFDRARIQVGRISHFGLLEMSRQRLRTGVLESSTESCPTCRGSGQVRSVSSLTLQILRALDDHLLRDTSRHLTVMTRPDAALYLLNHKRSHLAQLEARNGLSITVEAEPPENGSAYLIEKGERVDQPVVPPTAIAMTHIDDEPEDDADAGQEAPREEASREDDGEPRRKRRRRRRRRGEEADQAPAAAEEVAAKEVAAMDAADEEAAGGEAEVSATETADADDEDQPRKRRRRGRRGGRRRKRGEDGEALSNGAAAEATAGDEETVGYEEAAGPETPEPADDAEAPEEGDQPDEKPADRLDEPIPLAAARDEDQRPHANSGDIDEARADNGQADAPQADDGQADAVEPDEIAAEAPSDPTAKGEAGDEPDADESRPVMPKRSGWWQRRSFL